MLGHIFVWHRFRPYIGGIDDPNAIGGSVGGGVPRADTCVALSILADINCQDGILSTFGVDVHFGKIAENGRDFVQHRSLLGFGVQPLYHG